MADNITITSLAANMRHAARNRALTTIGGGIFSAEELNAGAAALDAHDDLVESVKLAIKHMPYSDDPEVKRAIEKMYIALKKAGVK